MRVVRRVTCRPGLSQLAVVGVLLSATGLAGCSYDMSDLLTSSTGSGDGAIKATQLLPANRKTIIGTVAYRAAIGPPDDVGRDLTRQLNDAAVDQGLALVIDPNVKSNVALRGYVTAMRIGATVNITYLWDVLDASGKRIHRISGEDAMTNGVDVKQPWGAVTPAVSRMIAQRTMSELSQWMKANVASTAREGIASGAPLVPRPAGAGAGSVQH